jgi:signal peptidase I
MEDTLSPGDKVIVSKLKYGPKLPESLSEIPWLNIFYFSNRSVHEKLIQPYSVDKRLMGTGNIDRQDILIFKFPNYKTTHFVKRNRLVNPIYQ